MLSVFITPWMNRRSSTARSAPPGARATARSSASGASGVPASSGSWRAIVWSTRRRSASRSPREAKNWKVPTRRWRGRHARQHRAGQRSLAVDRLAGGRHRQRRVVGMPRRAWPRRSAPRAAPAPMAALPSPPREKRGVRGPSPLKARSGGAVRRPARRADGAAVAELRREAAELVAGVGLAQSLGNAGCRRDRRTASSAQRHGSNPQLPRERVVEKSSRAVPAPAPVSGDGSAGQLAGVGMVEAEGAHAAQCAGDGLAPWPGGFCGGCRLGRDARQPSPKPGSKQPPRPSISHVEQHVAASARARGDQLQTHAGRRPVASKPAGRLSAGAPAKVA